MCDTIVAVGNATAGGEVLFAKNSDREPNEAHEVVYVPAARHMLGEQVQCTYITLPQVEETYGVLLAKPFWIWGAEMGSNEFGVTIGNEAVFTKGRYGKEPGLIGMDFLRLALERSRTAESALQTLIRLLEVYGQGGNCGFTHPFYYDNSYIVADTQEAWVLETAGQQWAAQKVQDVRSISNLLTIEDDWDLASADLISYAREQGWYKQGQKFSFRQAYGDFLYTRLGDGHRRRMCTTQALLSRKGRLTASHMMQVLREHGTAEGRSYHPGRGVTGASVCMHAGFGPVRASQTVGSMVSELRPEGLSRHWVTGTAAPCTSIFKPVWLDAVPDYGPAPLGVYDPVSLFWQHELLHREVLRAYGPRLAVYDTGRDALESRFVEEAQKLQEEDAPARRAFAQQCLEASAEAQLEWLANVREILPERQPGLYAQAWGRFNHQAGIPVL